MSIKTKISKTILSLENNMKQANNGNILKI